MQSIPIEEQDSQPNPNQEQNSIADSDSEHDSQPNPDPESNSIADSDSEHDSQPNPDPDHDAEPHMQPHAKSHPQSYSEPHPESHSEPDREPHSNSDPKQDPKSNRKPYPDTHTKQDSKSNRKPHPQSNREPHTDTNTDFAILPIEAFHTNATIHRLWSPFSISEFAHFPVIASFIRLSSILSAPRNKISATNQSIHANRRRKSLQQFRKNHQNREI
jgi:hypothetical protein